MPTNVVEGPDKLLYSAKWGKCSRYPPKHSKHTRLREAARTLGLNRDARKRLEWLLWHDTKANGNVSLTCRHFFSMKCLRWKIVRVR